MAGLVTGTQERVGFSLRRFLPPTALLHAILGCPPCWPAAAISHHLCRGTIWELCSYGGERLAESALTIDTSLPRINVDNGEQWGLYLYGKGDKPRAIPLLFTFVTACKSFITLTVFTI